MRQKSREVEARIDDFNHEDPLLAILHLHMVYDTLAGCKLQGLAIARHLLNNVMAK